jgi:hypothetical protein
MGKALLLVALVTLVACSDDAVAPPPGSAVFVIDVEGELFRVRIDDTATVTEARGLIVSGQARNINGDMARGTGGFNAGYSWHLRPHTVDFVDLTIELCDGMPSYVEEHVDYYVDTVKRYCPWGARVVSEVNTSQ